MTTVKGPILLGRYAKSWARVFQGTAQAKILRWGGVGHAFNNPERGM